MLVASPWERCEVDLGEGTPKLRVYFTNTASVAGFDQRGWVDCPHHGCRRYRPRHSHASRRSFCTEMYLWRFADGCDELSRAGHYDLQVSPAEVAASEASLRLESF